VDVLRTVISGQEFKSEEETFKQVFNRNPVSQCIIRRDGNVANVNRAYCELIGIFGPDIIGKPFISSYVREDQENLRLLIQRILEGKIFVMETYARLDKLDLDMVMHLTFFSIADARGFISQVSCVLQDIQSLQRLARNQRTGSNLF